VDREGITLMAANPRHPGRMEFLELRARPAIEDRRVFPEYSRILPFHCAL
jgi:hypothetical protein